MKLKLAIAVLGGLVVTPALAAPPPGALVFSLDSLPTGASGTYAAYQPFQDYTALGLGTIPSAQTGLNQTVLGTTLSLRTADYVYDPANPNAPQTRIGVENESSNFGYLGVPVSVQTAISATTMTTALPSAIFADFSQAVNYFSVDAFTFTSNPGFSFTVTAYSGLNGAGTVLGTTTGTVGTGVSYRSATATLSNLSGALSFGLLGSTAAAHYDNIAVTLAPTSSVPEPASWALMIGGLGMVGGAMRRRRSQTRPVLAV